MPLKIELKSYSGPAGNVFTAEYFSFSVEIC